MFSPASASQTAAANSRPAGVSDRPSHLRGLTLVEVMVAMVILSIIAMGIISAVFTIREDAENNLYESSALNVAMSFLEQMKSLDYPQIQDPPRNAQDQPYFQFIVNAGESLEVLLDEDRVLTIPIISNREGVAVKTLDVTIRPSATRASTMGAYWMEVDYSWDHPTRPRSYSGTLRSLRSEISTY